MRRTRTEEMDRGPFSNPDGRGAICARTGRFTDCL
jgi:hypothetical protein